LPAYTQALCSRPQVQPHEHSLGIGQISNDFPHWNGQFAHEGRDGKDLIPTGKLWIHQEVNNLYTILAFQVLFANPFQVRECGNRTRRLACNVKPQLPDFCPTGGLR
jgi:hypothetical protein